MVYSSHWSVKYMGIPYEEKNCAELAAEILLNEFEFDMNLPFIPKSLVLQSKLLLDESENYFRCEEQEGALCLLEGNKGLFHTGVFYYNNDVGHILHTWHQSKFSVGTPIHRLAVTGFRNHGTYTWQR